MNEKLMNDLLASAIRNGDLPLEMDDTFVDTLLSQPCPGISEVSKARFKSRLKARIQDAAISKARKEIHQSAIPFGRFIETVREKAGLKRVAIGERLQKPDDFVERLERGHINPIQLAPREFADVVELFHLPLSLLPPMLAASTHTANAKQGFRAIARSHGGVRHNQRGEDVERALEAFARTVKRASSPVAKPSDEVQASLAKLEKELKRRGRTDLLT
jgi:hypothetical protein